MANDTSRERLRRSYKPNSVRILFVGESPPAGGTFFYDASSNLFRHTQQAFSRAFDKTFESGKDFLNFFKSQGCYLEDLCHVSINRKDNAERRRYRTKSIKPLAERIRITSPVVVVVVMLAIRPQVEQAVRQSGVNASTHFLPFPTSGHQREYVDELVNILHRLQANTLLDDLSKKEAA